MPAAVVASCVERAEGNPLFLLQLLLNAGEARAGEPAGLDPGARPRPHGPARRATTRSPCRRPRCSASASRVDALRHLLDDPAYDSRLLVEHFLVRPDGSEFMFCHALIRDGAYESLLHKRRRVLHARAAEWFESRDLVLAAEHFDRAEDPRAAAGLPGGERLGRGAVPPRGGARARSSAASPSPSTPRDPLRAAHGARPPAARAGPLRRKRSRPCRAALEAVGQSRRAGPGADRAAPRGCASTTASPKASPRSTRPSRWPTAAGARARALAPASPARQPAASRSAATPTACASTSCAPTHARDAGSLEAEAAALGGLGDGYYLQGRMRSANRQFRECVALAREHGFGRLEVANLSMIGWTGDAPGRDRRRRRRRPRGHRAGAAGIAAARRDDGPRARRLGSTAWFATGATRPSDRPSRRCALVRALGAKRFESQLLGVSAVIALRRRRSAAGARARRTQALAICREHGMGHIGPWRLRRPRAGRRPTRQRAVRLLEEGDRQLALGCVSHNHLQLRELAIDALLEIGDWDGVDRNCERIRAYTAREPLALCDFIVARGAALARLGRGRAERRRCARRWTSCTSVAHPPRAATSSCRRSSTALADARRSRSRRPALR